MAGKKKRGAAQVPASEKVTPAASGTDRLYTQCPQCKTTYRITVAQLRLGRGEAECQECQARFNVLGALAENPARAVEDASVGQPTLLGRLDAVPVHASGTTSPSIPSELAEGDDEATNPASWLGRVAWGGGTLALLALFVFQLGGFEGPRLAQDEGARPWLEAACQTLGCRLPGFHAPRRIQIIDHTLSPAPDGIDGYAFSVVLANQAALPQDFPAIKLVLAGHDGSPVAARVFQPAEYLKGSAMPMAVGEPREIRLLLARPSHEVGGFSFELL